MLQKRWPVITPTDDVTHIEVMVCYWKLSSGRNGVYIVVTPGKLETEDGFTSWICMPMNAARLFYQPMERQVGTRVKAANEEIESSIRDRQGKAFEFLESTLKAWGHEIVVDSAKPTAV